MASQLIKIFFLILFSLSFLILPKTAQAQSILYVPDDYPTIQGAVNAASPGDTIIVRDGVYTENINVNKDHLIIKSEKGAEKTIIQAADPNDHVFEVTVDYVTIGGFTVKGVNKWQKAGIYLKNAHHCHLFNNRILDNFSDGIALFASSEGIIKENRIAAKSNGLSLNSSSNNQIIENEIYSATNSGIVLLNHSHNNSIEQNSLHHNAGGLYFHNSHEADDYNKVKYNEFLANNLAISFYHSSSNVIYLNNFKNSGWKHVNQHSVYSADWNSDEEITYIFNGETYKSFLGNYWDDYTGDDPDGNGIGNTRHILFTHGSWVDGDNYPLMKPFENYGISGTPLVTKDFPSLLQNLFIFPFSGKVRDIKLIENKSQYNQGDIIKIIVDTENTGTRPNRYFVDLYIFNPNGRKVYHQRQLSEKYLEEGYLNEDQKLSYNFKYSLPSDALSGRYQVVSTLTREMKLFPDFPVDYRGILGVAPPETTFQVSGALNEEKISEDFENLRTKIQNFKKTVFPALFNNQWVLSIDPLKEEPIWKNYRKVILIPELTINANDTIERLEGSDPELYSYALLPSSSVGCRETFIARKIADWVFRFKEKTLKELVQEVVKLGIKKIVDEGIANLLSLLKIGKELTVCKYETKIKNEATVPSESFEVFLPCCGNEITIGIQGITESYLGASSGQTTPAVGLSVSGEWKGTVSEKLNEIKIPLEISEDDLYLKFLLDLFLSLKEEDYQDVEQVKIASPGEIRVYDSHGYITGSVQGKIQNEIPKSVYDKNNRVVTIFHATDAYRYEVTGIDEGTYGLTITSVENGEVTTFMATDIPTLPGTIHQYTISWEALSQGEEGVNVQIDTNGDGIFEQTIILDSEFSQDEYLANLPRSIKEKVKASLENAKTGDKKVDQKIDQILKYLKKSLDESLWINENHLHPQKGRKVFQAEAQAIRKIRLYLRLEQWFGKSRWLSHYHLPESIKSAFNQAINDLVKADKILAEICLEEAKNISLQNYQKQKVVNRLIKQSTREMARATILSKIRPEQAINHYGLAWQLAQKVIKFAKEKNAP